MSFLMKDVELFLGIYFNNRFIDLIEFEWIRAGFPFPYRNSSVYISDEPKSSIYEQSGPTFLLFLNCVYQVEF